MITIVDYGMGNLHSVLKAFEHLGVRAQIACEVRSLETADKIILPGVGAFADAMTALRQMQLVEPLIRAINNGKPFSHI